MVALLLSAFWVGGGGGCCGVVGGWGLVFRCLSCVCCLLVPCVGLVVWGCGVVVWELYSEREHLADEMSSGVLFLGFLGCLSLVCVILLDCFIAQF